MAVSERHQKRRTEGCDVESHENMTEEEDGRCGDGERLLQCLVDVRLFNTIEWSMWGGIKSYFLFFLGTIPSIYSHVLTLIHSSLLYID